MTSDAGLVAGTAGPGDGPAAGTPGPDAALPVQVSTELGPDGRLTAGTRLPGGESQAADLRQLRSLGRLRGAAALLGPAFVAAVAYVDPGNFATNFSAGAVAGYSLAWVIVAANLMAMLVQYLSAKAGVATGKDLPELCRAYLPRAVSRGLWVQAELIAMAT